MKSFLVIGMGRFGAKLAMRLSELGNDVMIIDTDEERIQALSSTALDAQIGDCTNQEVLKTIGIRNFDACFVAMGDNFQSSLEVTSLLSEMGAKKVISRAESDIQSKFLLRNGADEVVYPTRDSAQRLAMRMSAKNMFDFMEISSEFSISETPVPESWVGKSILELDVRKKYHINILAIKQEDDINAGFTPSYIFNGKEHIISSGRVEDLMKFSART
ncbi:MAG: TrkA family potassium uptake protein [Clostridia bacterium]|nr:TrkA family potassium uptake protein [Clostridia bacterium]